MAGNKNQDNQNERDQIIKHIDQEFQEVQQELKEVDMLLNQSKGEVEKLTQRNASVNAHLQRIQKQIENIPPSDIRLAYDAAIEAHQRLAVMRGQLEKLQSDKDFLLRLESTLKRIVESKFLSSGNGVSDAGTANSIEMMTLAQESERQRLSRQMHDGPAQALSNFILQTEIAMRLFDVDHNQAKDELVDLKGAASRTFEKVRDFIFDLRPMMLDDLGLIPTVKRYAENYANKSDISVPVNISGTEQRLESYIEVVVFRAVQELISAESLHEEASEINIKIAIMDDVLRLSIEDNGRGFDMKKVPEEAQLGINAIRERLEMLGGSFEIDVSIGQGARFSIVLPITSSVIAP